MHPCTGGERSWTTTASAAAGQQLSRRILSTFWRWRQLSKQSEDSCTSYTGKWSVWCSTMQQAFPTSNRTVIPNHSDWLVSPSDYANFATRRGFHYSSSHPWRVQHSGWQSVAAGSDTPNRVGHSTHPGILSRIKQLTSWQLCLLGVLPYMLSHTSTC